MGPVGVIPSSKTDALPLLENVLYSVVVVRVYSFNKPFDSVMGGGNMVSLIRRFLVWFTSNITLSLSFLSVSIFAALLPLESAWSEVSTAANEEKESKKSKKKDKKRPNFVWLISEDNSKHYLRLYDEQGAVMPNVEFLAKQGLVFDNAFSNSPVCSTARTILATGAYGARLGTHYHRAYRKIQLNKYQKPLSLLLKQFGYYTSNDAKEDYNFLPQKGLWNKSKRGADWRARKLGQPFYHVQSFSVTHESQLHFPESDVKNVATLHNANIMEVPPYYPDTALFRYTYARYLDQHKSLDKQLGEVIQKLKNDGVLEDTFVFYFGDHGGALPGSKGYLFERGLNVPLVIRIPKNFRHLVDAELQNPKSLRITGFVNFVDFAPTIISLAGLKSRFQHDGTAFLGKQITKRMLNQRYTSLAFADRFDEKSDLVRSLRKGKYKYIRNYMPFYRDSMFNHYRYKQAAFRQWKQYYEDNKLNSVQSQFFSRKMPEMLFDMESDPYETKNLAQDPKFFPVLDILRKELYRSLRSLPDLGFFPESYLVNQGLPFADAFGKQNTQRISQLITIADAQLQKFGGAKWSINDGLKSDDPLKRYWAIISLGAFGNRAESLFPDIRKLLDSEMNVLVKARALEFLGFAGEINPVAALEELFIASKDDLEALEIMNIATALHEEFGYSFDFSMKEQWQVPDKKSGKGHKSKAAKNSYFVNRISYLK